MEKTRIVRLKTGHARGDATNSNTVIIDLNPPHAPGSFKKLFVKHYERIRDVCLGYQRPGLAMIAIDHRGVAATACLGAKPRYINSAIIGRHGMADVYLDADPGLSLRHLVVGLYPLAAGRDLRFRLLDLRTSAAFVDESGRRLAALEAEGPVFVGCGRYALFFLPTGEELPWPTRANAGWQCIPDRVYFGDEPAEPDRWQRGRPRRGAEGERPEQGDMGGKRHTLVQTLPGPSRARRRLVANGEEPIGELSIHSATGESSILVGAATAREGVLLGRYDRCDTEGLPVLSNERISRVHCMLLRLGEQLYVIDLASTNGLYVGTSEARVVPLDYGQSVMLGNKLATLAWKAVH